eukprot:Opistho-2@45537
MFVVVDDLVCAQESNVIVPFRDEQPLRHILSLIANSLRNYPTSIEYDMQQLNNIPASDDSVSAINKRNSLRLRVSEKTVLQSLLRAPAPYGLTIGPHFACRLSFEL